MDHDPELCREFRPKIRVQQQAESDSLYLLGSAVGAADTIDAVGVAFQTFNHKIKQGLG